MSPGGETAPTDYSVKDFSRDVSKLFNTYQNAQDPETRQATMGQIEELCKNHPSSYKQYMEMEIVDYS